MRNTDIFPARTEVATENRSRSKSNSVTFSSPSPWLKEGAIVEKLLEIGTLQSKNTGRNQVLSVILHVLRHKEVAYWGKNDVSLWISTKQRGAVWWYFLFSFESFSFAHKDCGVASICNYRCVTWIERGIYYWSAVMSYCKRELKSLL